MLVNVTCSGDGGGGGDDGDESVIFSPWTRSHHHQVDHCNIAPELFIYSFECLVNVVCDVMVIVVVMMASL